MHRLARVAKRRIRACLFAVGSLTFCATWASAEVSQVYRWLDRDGTPVYSDSPPPRGTAHRVYLIRTEPGAQAQSDAAATKECDGAALAKRASVHRETVAEAQARLSRVRERKEAGREPLPGERLGNAGGGSRLAPDYFARQDALETQLKQAQAALSEASRRQAESADRIASAC